MSSKTKILIVEDDPVLRMVTKSQVVHFGYSCQAVANGEEAMSSDLSDVGLILMDIGLPGIDGVTAAKLIRERETSAPLRRVPIVGLTAHSNRESCLSAGMDDFVQKPALLEDIQRVLKRWALSA
jgi:CheY-like chemotaxis protein